jgi:hypothetical protein
MRRRENWNNLYHKGSGVETPVKISSSGPVIGVPRAKSCPTILVHQSANVQATHTDVGRYASMDGGGRAVSPGAVAEEAESNHLPENVYPILSVI